MSLTNLDKKIIREIQKDLPITTNPYLNIAEKLGISEENLLKKIQEFIDKGYIRRFGATLRHRKVGINANAMAVWSVPDKDVEKVGKRMASFKEVTHCYERYTIPEWNGNLFTMIHAKTKEECLKIVKKISEETGIKDYELLFSTEEFKKTSMEYF
ncbi:MAG: siroheme decarboxylase subunit beta [Pseudomonadota bacterium]